MKTALWIVGLSWAALWWTPDQRGQHHFEQKEYAAAAQEFSDPDWQGTAWYRAGQFDKAAEAFARLSSPEARFNEGNAWLMQGKYQNAIDRYDQALKLRPDWKAAQENRELAAARAKLIDNAGADAGDQREGADQIVFDKNKPGGQDTQIAGEQATSDLTVQSMWLRRVQTKPADFLRSKFAYQLSMESEEPDQ